MLGSMGTIAKRGTEYDGKLRVLECWCRPNGTLRARGCLRNRHECKDSAISDLRDAKRCKKTSTVGVNGVFQQLRSCEFFSHSSSSSSSCEFHSHSSSQLVAPVTLKLAARQRCRAASFNLTAATTVATSCENVTHSSSTLSSCGEKWALSHSCSKCSSQL